MLEVGIVHTFEGTTKLKLRIKRLAIDLQQSLLVVESVLG